jgi:hypothetical protein
MKILDMSGYADEAIVPQGLLPRGELEMSLAASRSSGDCVKIT